MKKVDYSYDGVETTTFADKSQTESAGKPLLDQRRSQEKAIQTGHSRQASSTSSIVPAAAPK